jgi:hypothetical protein
MLRQQRKEARAGRALPFAVVVDGRLAGQVSVSSIVRGAFDGGHVGYWVDERVAGAACCRPRWRWCSTTASARSGCTGSRPTSGRRTPRPAGWSTSSASARRAAPALPVHRRAVARPRQLRPAPRGPAGGRPAPLPGRELNFPRRAGAPPTRPGPASLASGPVGSGLILLVIVGAWLAFFVQLALRSTRRPTSSARRQVPRRHAGAVRAAAGFPSQPRRRAGHRVVPTRAPRPGPRPRTWLTTPVAGCPRQPAGRRGRRLLRPSCTSPPASPGDGPGREAEADFAHRRAAASARRATSLLMCPGRRLPSLTAWSGGPPRALAVVAAAPPAGRPAARRAGGPPAGAGRAGHCASSRAGASPRR